MLQEFLQKKEKEEKMMDQELKEVIDQAAEEAANKAIAKLKKSGRITYYFSNSFKKTEEILYLYPNLPNENSIKNEINSALDKIKNDEYCDVIASKYFDGMTVEEISEIYDVNIKTISKNKNRLIRILSAKLFPEDVLNEIMQK